MHSCIRRLAELGMFSTTIMTLLLTTEYLGTKRNDTDMLYRESQLLGQIPSLLISSQATLEIASMENLEPL